MLPDPAQPPTENYFEFRSVPAGRIILKRQSLNEAYETLWAHFQFLATSGAQGTQIMDWCQSDLVVEEIPPVVCT